MTRHHVITTPYGDITAEREADGRVSVGYGGEHDGPEGVKNHLKINGIPYQVRMSLIEQPVFTLDWGPNAGKPSSGFRVDHASIYRLSPSGSVFSYSSAGVTQKAMGAIYHEVGRIIWDHFNERPELLTEAWRALWEGRYQGLLAAADVAERRALELRARAADIRQNYWADEKDGVPCPHAEPEYQDGNRSSVCKLCGRSWQDIKQAH